VRALKGITEHPDEPWDFWAYLKRVIKVAVIPLYQFLKVKRGGGEPLAGREAIAPFSKSRGGNVECPIL